MSECAVPENIYTLPMKGNLKLVGGGLQTSIFFKGK